MLIDQMSLSSVICSPLIASQGRWVFLQPLCEVRSLHFRVVANHWSRFFLWAQWSWVPLSGLPRLRIALSCGPWFYQPLIHLPPMLISVDDLINKMQNVIDIWGTFVLVLRQICFASWTSLPLDECFMPVVWTRKQWRRNRKLIKQWQL